MTKDTAQTTPSLVPSKRKADDEIRQPDKTSHLSPKEGANDYGQGSSVDEAACDEYYQYIWGSEDEDLDLAFTAILEEENALHGSGFSAPLLVWLARRRCSTPSRDAI